MPVAPTTCRACQGTGLVHRVGKKNGKDYGMRLCSSCKGAGRRIYKEQIGQRRVSGEER